MAVFMIRLMVFHYFFGPWSNLGKTINIPYEKCTRQKHVNHKVFISLSCYNILDIVEEIHEQTRIPISLLGA